MMIVMRADATQDQVQNVLRIIDEHGLQAHFSQGAERAVIGVVGDIRVLSPEMLRRQPSVARVVSISKPFKLSSREFHPRDTVFPVGNVPIGGRGLVLIAGPCSVEDRTQLFETAQAVREAGAHILRGGAYKPRTSPYSFQGMGEQGLELLAEAGEATGMPVVTEVLEAGMVSLVARYAQMLQVGARNMQNYALLHAVGAKMHPVLLKRGMSASVKELLMAAEYILSHDNNQVVVCERGIRTFETATRNTTDINALPVLKRETHLPVFLDPSHSTGHWEYVAAIARAAAAAGAQGLMIEVHVNPEQALSDGGQSLKPERFARLVGEVGSICEALGWSLAATSRAPASDSSSEVSA